jgi:hypothetical protein
MLQGVFRRAQPVADALHQYLPEQVSQKLAKAHWIARVVFMEVYADFRHVIPLGLRWLYQRTVSQGISAYPLRASADKAAATASLYLHGALDVAKDQEVKPVLLVHGDYSHPFTLLHLAELAKRETPSPVFSLFIPGLQQHDRAEEHSHLIELAITKIQEMVKTEKGVFRGVIGVAHSRGTLHFAHRLLVRQDKRIDSVFAVGGRFHIPEEDTTCAESWKPFVRQISEAIQRKGKEPPLLSIIPEDDWNAPEEAMSKGLTHRHVSGSHLSGLYQPETSAHFLQFLRG